VTDGNTVKTLIDAATPGTDQWIVEPFEYFEPTVKGWLMAGYLTGIYDSDAMEPGVAYKVQTLKDNLALIIPAY